MYIHMHMCVCTCVCVCAYEYMNSLVVPDTLTFTKYLLENLFFHISSSPIQYKSNITDIIRRQSLNCFKIN